MFPFVLCLLFWYFQTSHSFTCSSSDDITTATNPTSSLSASVYDTRTITTGSGNVETDDYWFIESTSTDTDNRNDEWDFQLLTDPCEFSFKADDTTVMTYELFGECHTTECDMFFGFQVNDKWFSVMMDFDGYVDDGSGDSGQFVYPPCSGSLGTGDLSSFLGSQNIRAAIAGTSADWEYLAPASSNGHFMPTFQLTNNPITDTLTLALTTDSGITHSCIWTDSFESGTEIQYLQSQDDWNEGDESFNITQISVDCGNCECSCSPTREPTWDPTWDPTSDPTNDPTSDPTTDPTFDPTKDPTNDPTGDPTTDPTNDPTADPTWDPTFDPTTDPTLDPTSDPTSDPTADPTMDPTLDPTMDPTSDPTQDPTIDPTGDPTTNPTNDPTGDPTWDPTFDPTTDPTFDPTSDPTSDPTMDPTGDPTFDPTNDPTTDPTWDPTDDPTTDPTNDPTIDPTWDPTEDPTTPTDDPTADPTADPTTDPTNDPTKDPTKDPTEDPTYDPTWDPTSDPTTDPTWDPTEDPTIDPTIDPTSDPTVDPTSDPTMDPTSDPTQDPTSDPTIDPTEDPTLDPTSDPTTDPTDDPTRDPTSDPTMDPTEPTLQPTPVPIFLDLDDDGLNANCTNASCSIYNISLFDVSHSVNITECNAGNSYANGWDNGANNVKNKCVRNPFNNNRRRLRGMDQARRLGRRGGHGNNNGHGGGWGRSSSSADHEDEEDEDAYDDYITLGQVCLNYSIDTLVPNCGLSSLFLPICTNSDTENYFKINKMRVSDLNKLISSYSPLSVIKDVYATKSINSTVLGVLIEFYDFNNTNMTDNIEICFDNVIVNTSEDLNSANMDVTNRIEIGYNANWTEVCRDNDGLPCLNFYVKRLVNKMNVQYNSDGRSRGYNALSGGNGELNGDTKAFSEFMSEMDPMLRWSLLAIVITFVALILLSAYICLNKMNANAAESDNIKKGIETTIAFQSANAINANSVEVNMNDDYEEYGIGVDGGGDGDGVSGGNTNGFYDDLDLEMMQTQLETDELNYNDHDGDGGDGDGGDGDAYDFEVFGNGTYVELE